MAGVAEASATCTTVSTSIRTRVYYKMLTNQTKTLPRRFASAHPRSQPHGEVQLGFQNLANYIACGLLETKGCRPHLHPQL